MSDGTLESAIEYSKFLLEQIKLQREVRDRWFRFYLLVITAPLAAMMTLLQIDTIRKAISNMYWLFSIMSVCLFIIGLLFLLMHIRQRINSIKLYRKMNRIERKFIKTAIDYEEDDSKPISKGADFYADCIHIFLNSLCCTSAAVLLVLSTAGPSDSSSKVGTVVFLFILWFQFFIRSEMLSDYEFPDQK